MKRVLITGGSGFIGSNLAKRCIVEGWTVDIVDDLSNGHREFLPAELAQPRPGSYEYSNTKGHTFFKSDFAIGVPLQRIKNGLYDTVFHLAAVPRVSYSVEHPVETNDINVSRTLRLVEACRNCVGRFVFASSSSVYGGAEVLPTPETHPKDPKSPYALQKSIVEDYLALFGDLYRFDSACLRFFNVFGPYALGSSPYATALSAWLTSIMNDRPLRSDGDGEQSRDLCHVDNVVDACVKAAKCDSKMRGDRFNVACGQRTTNNEVLQHLMKRYPNVTKVDAPVRAGDVKHTLADVSAAINVLGYEPKVDVWSGIERTCDWYEANWWWIEHLRQRV